MKKLMNSIIKFLQTDKAQELAKDLLALIATGMKKNMELQYRGEKLTAFIRECAKCQSEISLWTYFHQHNPLS